MLLLSERRSDRDCIFLLFTPRFSTTILSMWNQSTLCLAQTKTTPALRGMKCCVLVLQLLINTEYSVFRSPLLWSLLTTRNPNSIFEHSVKQQANSVELLSGLVPTTIQVTVMTHIDKKTTRQTHIHAGKLTHHNTDMRTHTHVNRH
jgi:hypothetical protein